ncbi:MAG: hypothetical protein HYV75_05655 [Opitutae bacterium]|nr:hypothetical protein [Opitutae bacterium]
MSDQSADPGVNRSERYTDFWLFGGIHRPVYLELVPAESIDHIAIDARADGAFRMDVFVGSATNADRVTARVFDAQGRILGEELAAPHPLGADHVRLDARFAEAEPWSPEAPHLYRVEVSLKKGDQALHRLVSRFGFRTFEVIADGGFRLNGHRVTLKGVCRPSFRPDTGRTLSPQDSIEDVKLMKAMNANAVRAVHYPCDRHFLDACDELGLLVMTEYLAWMSPLPDESGVRELVERDHNHPSIILWANGNHRSFNPVLEFEFQRHDLQDRRALRLEPRIEGNVPQPARADVVPVDTRMYPNYAQLTRRLTQRYPVLPAESLHALYDGGGGAGLAEFWRAIEASPVGGGLFIWEFVDEAIARTDRNGELDSAGNRSADGVVGPHHEKEASFFAARDIFSPVQVETADAGPPRDGTVTVRNKFLTTDLGRCRFVRHLVKAAKPLLRETTTLPSPACAPGRVAKLDLALEGSAADFDYVVLEAFGPDSVLLRAWSWPLRQRADYAPRPSGSEDVVVEQHDNRIEVRAGTMHYLFEAATARLLETRRGATRVPFGGGPDLAWSTPAGNALPEHLRDGVARTIAPDDVKEGKKTPLSEPGRLVSGAPGTAPAIVHRRADGGCEIAAAHTRGFDRFTWNVAGDGTLRLDYAYQLEGSFDSFGITFDSEPAAIRAATWLGDGPHPVWQNRREGAHFGLWSKSRGAAVSDRSFDHPTFEGCHTGTIWFRLETAAGNIQVWLESPAVVARWLTPNWGEAPLNAIAALPPGDISFLHAMPGIGEKWMPSAELSPSGRPTTAIGSYQGTIVFRFE